jgi:hypothetical protein
MLKIKIDTKNDCFKDNFNTSIDCCLTEVINKIYKGITESNIYDINGNNVGNFKITGDK